MSGKETHVAILVVDDDENIRATIMAILEQEGYHVEGAGDGAEALRKAAKTLFNLALVDMRLPDMMGTELLSKLPVTVPKMEKIMVTGYPSMQNAIKSVNEGADGYLVKPVNAETLLEMIQKHLQKRAEATKYSEQKVAEYMQGRAKELAKSSTNQ